MCDNCLNPRHVPTQLGRDRVQHTKSLLKSSSNPSEALNSYALRRFCSTSLTIRRQPRILFESNAYFGNVPLSLKLRGIKLLEHNHPMTVISSCRSGSYHRNPIRLHESTELCEGFTNGIGVELSPLELANSFFLV